MIVREAAHAAVRAAVVDAIADQKSLGSVSRQAADGSTRLRALARVTDAEELLNVATKSEHTDAAVAALERIEGVRVRFWRREDAAPAALDDARLATLEAAVIAASSERVLVTVAGGDAEVIPITSESPPG